MRDYRYLYANLTKQAAAALTPEAEQAAMQPPMDPAMAGGMPPAAPGGMPAGAPPMDPAMMGGMPPAGGMPAGAPPMDPAMAGGMPPAGGQLPPEILQDQAFIDFLQQNMGIMLDPNTGMFMDPQSGQPIPPDMIIQAYQVFQQEQMAAQGGGAAPGGMPAGPAGAMPPAGDPAAAGAAGVPEEVINQIASAVMSGVEAVLQEYTAALEKKIGALLDKLETVKGSVDAMQATDDKRTQDDLDEDRKLREDIAADLQPTVKVASQERGCAPQQIVMPKAAARKPVSLYNVIVGGSK